MAVHAGQDRRRAIEEAAATMTPEQVAAIHAGLQFLASDDLDRARTINGVGFGKMDNEVGHSLAAAGRLSPRQAALGQKILRRYRRTQLPPEIVAAIWKEEEA